MNDDASQDGRYAPPLAHVADVEPTQHGMVLASRWNRLWAAVIDGLVAALALWLLSKVTPWNPWAVAQVSVWTPQPLSMLGGFAVFLALQGYLLATRCQTIGKYLLNTRIVRSDGTRPSFGRLIGLRYGIGSLAAAVPGVAQIWGVLDCLLIFRTSRKCLHDSIADTVVVKA